MAKEYSDSCEFTADLDKMVANLNDAMMILQKPEFAAWMKSTDENYAAPNNEFQIEHRLLTRLAQQVHKQAYALEMNLIELDEPKEQDNG